MSAWRVTSFDRRARPALGALTLVGALAGTPAAADARQQYTHPRDMRMPSPAFERPDPAAYRQQVGDLVAYIVEDRRVPLVTISAFVRSGYADAPVPAVARAVEHALRAGPASLAGGEFDAQLAGMIAEWRVAMGPELTELSLDVPAEDATRAIELLVATLRAPRFRDVPAARAAAALRSETATGESGPVLYEGSLQLAVDLFHEWLFDGHAYGGHATTPVTADAARDFHASHVVPANIVLAVAGDIATDEARRLLAAALDGWTGAVPARARRTVDSPRRPTQRAIRAYDTDKLQGWVVLGHDLPPVPARDAAALEVMNYILGGGHFDTRLFRELRDKRGLANTGGGFPDAQARGPGSYTFRTYGRPAVIPLLIELTLGEIERMRRELVTADELAIAQGALADGAFAMRYADGYATARSFAEEWARHGDHERSASYIRRILAVTREDVRTVARRYLEPERFRIVVVGPLAAIAAGSHPETTKRLEDFGRVEGGFRQ
jgi:zinc protease